MILASSLGHINIFRLSEIFTNLKKVAYIYIYIYIYIYGGLHIYVYVVGNILVMAASANMYA